MDLPHLSDSVAAAVIAGAFALVGQSAVKVWEVRQRRRDEVAQIYSARLAAVRRAGSAMRRLISTANDLRAAQAALRRLNMTPGMTNLATVFGQPTVKEDQQELVGQLRADLQGRQQALHDATDALNESESLFLLYARSPLRWQNAGLTRALTMVLADQGQNPAVAEEVDQWARRFARVAHWELSAIGSILFSAIGYQLVCLYFSTLAPLGERRRQKRSKSAARSTDSDSGQTDGPAGNQNADSGGVGIEK